MYGYKVLEVYILCGFLICVILGNGFITTTLNATASHKYLKPNWTDINDSEIYVWIIKAVYPEARVRIDSSAFQFHDKGNQTLCAQYLQVNDGERRNSDVLGRWCGRHGPRIISSGHSLTIVFDPKGSYASFKILYFGIGDATVPNSNQIKLQADRFSRIFSSPGYTLNYFNNMNYIWKIVGQEGGRVKAEIVSADFFRQTFFDNDFLQIYDGDSVDAPSLGIIQESNSRVFISSGIYLTVTFRTDSAFVGKGFQMRYTQSGCSSGRLTTKPYELKYITSPGYPGFDNEFRNCTWTITSTSDIVRVEIIHLNLESSFGCRRSYLALYDGNQAIELDRLCGNQNLSYTNLVYESFSNEMIINYLSSGSEPSKFRLKYTAAETDREFVLHPNETRIIFSANYPELYPNNANEWWRIHTGWDRIITIVSLSFSLEDSAGCGHDHLNVYDGLNTGDLLLGKWCGTRSITAHSTGQFLYLNFITDSGVQGRGFQIEITTSKRLITPSTSTEDKHFPSVVVTGFIIGLLILIAIVAALVYRSRKQSRNRQTTRQTNRQTTRQTNRQTNRRTHRQTNRQTHHRQPNTTRSSTTTQISVVEDHNASDMAPPEYSEVVKDGPPTYFDVIHGDSGLIVTGSREILQGVDNPSLSRETN